MFYHPIDALIKTYAGKRPFLGNNPICFAAPCKDEEPFCLDMATSITTFNKIKQLKEKGLRAPLGVGSNKDGVETVDPNEITMLSPIGGYKGYGLSLAIEILCSLLTGMPYGPHIPKMFEAPMDQKRFLGHFISAIRIDCFQDIDYFKERLARMLKEIRREPPLDKIIPIKVSGDPEKEIYKQRIKDGIPLAQAEYRIIKELGLKYGCVFYEDRKVKGSV